MRNIMYSRRYSRVCTTKNIFMENIPFMWGIKTVKPNWVWTKTPWKIHELGFSSHTSWILRNATDNIHAQNFPKGIKITF